MNSLQARVGVGLVLTLVALFAVQWWVVSASLRHLTEEYVGSRLEHDSEGLLAGLSFGVNGEPQLGSEYIDPIFHRPYSGHYYVVRSGKHVLRSRSLWDQDLLIAPLSAGDKQQRLTVGPEQQTLLMRVAGYHKRGRDVTIAVAEDYSPIEEDYREFQWRYVFITVVVLIALMVVQVWMVRRGLRPLKQVRADIQRLERGEIAQLSAAVPREVAPLVAEINHLISVMAQRLERSRHALGNLAHAVKTPLTVLKQLLVSDELAREPQLQAQLSAQADDIGHYVQRELKRARLAGAATPGRHFDVSGEVPALVDALREIYREKNLAIETRLPEGASVAAEREDMLELFGNLLDNACKWAHARVRLVVAEQSGLVFTVEDDGPGAPAAQLAQLTERGVRIDEAVSGHGLGLAIVREIVAHYGGELRFGSSQALGGFRVEVSLPAPS